MIGLLSLLAGILAMTIAIPVASASTGGCTEVFFQSGYMGEDTKQVFNDDKFQVVSYKTETPVYRASTGSDRAKAVLGFDQRYRVSDPGEGTQRIKIRKQNDEEVGWVDRDEVLCRVVPLTDAKTGLLRRMVVQTETAVQNQVVPRNAYHTPTGKCEGGMQSCPKLSRFRWYFVYAEEAGHVLISEAANLGRPDARVVGWLPLNDGIIWNTAVALRPSEGLSLRKAADGKSEAHVCAFPTLDAMKDPKACRPILGGPQWFKSETRLPVLGDIGHAYEVAISSAATTGTFEEAMSLAGVGALKNVDVFFVIDGTKSMQYIIDAIKGRPGYPGIVDQVRSRMRGKVRQGGSLRYGFRIYRDSVKGGPTGVEEEGLALPDDCGANEEKFVDAFKSVQARDTNGDTDFAENSYGGLIQAARDFESCADHLKLIVLIGDHGYDADAQRQRGHKSFDAQTLTERYLRGKRLKTQPVVFVIQGPNELATVTNKEAYQKAYDDFRNQGQALLKSVYGFMSSSGVPVSAEDFYFALANREADAAVIDRIIARVDGLLHPDVIGKLAERLKGGESLTDAINAMRKGDTTNVPILYWNVVADALCKRLGSQCNKTVLEGVFRGYIAHSAEVTHDVLLSRNQLDHWRELLGKFKEFWAQMRTGKSSRDQLVGTLVESIGSVIKTEIDDRGRSMGDIAQFVGGLPHGSRSKLMAYTPAELRDQDRVKECEIQHLVNYGSKKSDIIQIVLEGDKLATFTEETLPTTACPSLTPKGKQVAYMPGAPRPRSLNPAEPAGTYSITFRKGNDVYYWVPLGYLP